MMELNIKSQQNNRLSIRAIVIITIVICAIIIGAAYWYVSSRVVYIDLSVVKAPIISLSPKNPGTLQAYFVKVGDMVTPNQPIARVGNEIVKSQIGGEIVSVNQNIGEFENPMVGQGVVATMIDPNQLRVVGHIDEDKGLSQIAVGDIAKFTVDAFGSKEYYGVVDEISQTSTGFTSTNIFNKRPTYQFDVYVRFNPAQYPELKDGMSARLWVYVK